MTNTELRHLVKLYWKVKQELNKKTEAYDKVEIERKVYSKISELVKREEKDIRSKKGSPHFRAIEDNLLEEQSKLEEKVGKEFKSINDAKTRNEIERLERKLEAIKELLGDDVEKIEKNEREQILKSIPIN